jgi:hypothetical protein
MGYIKEPFGIEFAVESKSWSEAEKESMRNIIASEKRKSEKRKLVTSARYATQK